MRNLFTEPVMNISLFDVDDVITTSGGINGAEVTDPTTVSAYTRATTNWQTTGQLLQFTEVK